MVVRVDGSMGHRGGMEWNPGKSWSFADLRDLLLSGSENAGSYSSLLGFCLKLKSYFLRVLVTC